MGDIFFDQIFADEYKQRIRENKERVTREVTERVTREVTERVTREVTEQVTREVTKEVTEQVTSNYIRRLMDSLNVDVNKVFELLNIAPSEQEEYIRLIKHA